MIKVFRNYKKSLGFITISLLISTLILWLTPSRIYINDRIPELGTAFSKGYTFFTTVPGADGSWPEAFNKTLNAGVFHSALNQKQGHLLISLPTPQLFGRVRFIPQENLPQRLPAHFSIEGSTNGNEWKLLGEYKEQAADTTSEVIFSFENSQSFNHYKINFFDSRNNLYLTFSEIYFDEAVALGGNKTSVFWLLGLLCTLTIFMEVRSRRQKEAASHPLSIAPFLTVVLFPLCIITLIAIRVFVSNGSEYYSTTSHFALGLILGIALLGFLTSAVAVLARKLFPSIINKLLFASFTLGILTWAFANIFTTHVGLLDGTSIDWNNFRYAYPIELLGSCALIVFIIMNHKQLLKILVKACLIFILISAVDAAVRIPAVITADKNKSFAAGSEKMYSFSKSGTNVLIILLDMVQGDVFNGIVESNSIIRDAFSGFTYFRNTVAGYPVTIGSVPNILTSALFRNETTHDDFLANAFTKHSLPKYFSSKNFDVAITKYIPKEMFLSPDIVKNAIPTKFSAATTIQEIIQTFDVALLSSTPLALKSAFYQNGQWLLSSLWTTIINGKRQGVPSTQKALDYIHINEFNKYFSLIENSNTFKFYHFVGGHPPIDTDENGQALPPGTPQDRAAYIRQVTGALKLATSIITRLKQSGVFDNSLIIVASDHGFGFPARFSDLAENEATADWLARALPMLTIKRPRDSDKTPLQISDVPAELGDLPNTIAAEIFNEQPFPFGRSVFEITDVNRERTFLMPEMAFRNGYLNKISEYKVNGPAYKTSSFRLTGANYLPPN